MAKLLRTFEPNERGRDFAIGDLHGSIELLEALLLHLNFDPLVDRMFSVGDLIDRGPESLRTLALIKESWFNAVLANHEQMMLDAFDDGPMGEYWIPNGGMWGLQTVSNFLNKRPPIDPEEHELLELLPLVRELPLLITVKQKSGKRVHLLHAELPPGVGGYLTDADLEDEAMIAELLRSESREGSFILWGRHLYYQFYKADLSRFEKTLRTVEYLGGSKAFNPALGHIVSGHTPVQRPLTIYGQTNIDTCAFDALRQHPPAWCALTCLNLDTWEFWQATRSGVRQVQPVVVNTESSQGDSA